MNGSHVVLSALLLIPMAWLNPLAGDDKKSTKFELSDDEKTLLDLTNKERAKENLPALTVNPLLVKIARDHSANMARQGEMNHVLDGKGPAERAKAAGYDYLNLAENLAAAENSTLADLMKGWMESKIHRENILRKEVSEIGMGLARTDKGMTYYTQMFGTARKK